MFYIETRNERLNVAEDGRVISRAIGGKMVELASGQWRILGAVPVRPFGRLGALVPLADLPRENLSFKNGRPRYHLVDFDHGTERIWGDGLRAIRTFH